MDPSGGPELTTLREQKTDSHAKNSAETSTPAPRLSVPKHLVINLCERGITPRPADALRVCGRSGCNAVSRAKLSSPRRHPLLLCSGCKSIAYCSKECQAAAWAAGHKQECASVHAAQSGPRAGGEGAVRRPAPTGHTAQQRRLVIHLQERRQIGDLPCAERIQAEMLGIARTVEKTWPEGAMSIYNNLGLCCQMAGKYQQALELHDEHLAIATRVGDRGGEGAATGNVGNCLDSLGEYESSEKMHEISLAIAVQVGDKDAEGACCGNLANVKDSLGKSGQEMKERLLKIAKESGEALKFGDLEHCSFRLGQYAQALVIPRADDARTSLSELVKLGPLFDAALSRPKPLRLSLDGTKSKASAGFRARTGDMSRTVPNVPRELVLFSGVRMTTPGHRDGVFIKDLRRPRAILPEGGALGVLQPRDLSLILADAYKEDRDVYGPSKRADEQKVAQRARKPRGFALLDGPASKASNQNKHRLGYLGLQVVSAAHLSAGDAFGSADPFVDLWVSNKQQGKQKFKTSTKFKTRNPIWEESFKFSIWNAQDTIELRVFDYDEVGSNDFLGLKTLSMMDLFRQVNGGKEPQDFSSFTKTETYQLVGHSGTDYVDAECTVKVSGSIVLEFTFESLPKPSVAALTQKPNLHGLSAAKKPVKTLLPEKQTKELLEKLAFRKEMQGRLAALEEAAMLRKSEKGERAPGMPLSNMQNPYSSPLKLGALMQKPAIMKARGGAPPGAVCQVRYKAPSVNAQRIEKAGQTEAVQVSELHPVQNDEPTFPSDEIPEEISQERPSRESSDAQAGPAGAQQDNITSVEDKVGQPSDEAFSSLSKIDKQDILELAGLNKPKAIVNQITDAILALNGVGKEGRNWAAARNMMKRGDEFIAELKFLKEKVESRLIPDHYVSDAKLYLSLDIHDVEKTEPAAASLLKFLLDLVRCYERNRLGDEEDQEDAGDDSGGEAQGTRMDFYDRARIWLETAHQIERQQKTTRKTAQAPVPDESPIAWLSCLDVAN